ELALDEAGQSAAVGAVGGLAQEGFQVLAHDAMEDGALRGPGLIRGDGHRRRASEARAVRGSVRRTAIPPWTARRTATWIRNAALRAASDRAIDVECPGGSGRREQVPRLTRSCPDARAPRGPSVRARPPPRTCSAGTRGASRPARPPAEPRRRAGRTRPRRG